VSLINRMLRDLSTRQPPAGNVMSGIQLPAAETRARGGSLGRLGVLVVLVAGFTGGLWWMFGPRSHKVPQPPSAPVGAVVASDPAPVTVSGEAPPAPAPLPPIAAREAESAHLKLDTQLSTPVAAAPAPKPKAPPADKPKPKAQVRKEPTVEPAVATAQPAQPLPQEAVTMPRVAVASAPTAQQSADTLYAQARRDLERGDDKAAETALIDALALDPKLHGAREELGSLRIRQGRLEEAERNVRIGLEQSPGWVGYRRLVARLELARGRPAGALAALDQGVPPVENDVEYHALLASTYQRLNRHEEASRTYQGLTRVQPEQARWWAGYAMSRDALNDVSGALAAYARARQLGGLPARVLEHIDRRTAVLQAAG